MAMTAKLVFAIDADADAEGPIYIQGNLPDSDYRNMILRPAI